MQGLLFGTMGTGRLLHGLILVVSVRDKRNPIQEKKVPVIHIPATQKVLELPKRGRRK